jgi:hypothetical protein
LTTVAALTQFAIDLDFRSLRATPSEIDSRLKALPPTPTQVRRTGGGRHVIYQLRKEISADDASAFGKAIALLKRLTGRMS